MTAPTSAFTADTRREPMTRTGTHVVVSIFIEDGQSARPDIRVDITSTTRTEADDAAWRPDGSGVDTPPVDGIWPVHTPEADTPTRQPSSVSVYSSGLAPSSASHRLPRQPETPTTSRLDGALGTDLGAEVALGASRRRLLVAGAVAAVIVVAVFTIIGQRSGRTRATASAAASTTDSGAVDHSKFTATSASVVDGGSMAPSGPVACRGDAPWSPEGCTPAAFPATGSATVAAACLTLIQTAAQAMAVDSDTYARVVAQPEGARTVDDAIHEHLTQARLFLASQSEKTGSLADADVIARLDALDSAIYMADTRPCSGSPVAGSGSAPAPTTTTPVSSPAGSTAG
jgi:hypothetical protein